MKTVNIDGHKTAFISEDGFKISFSSTDIVEYEIKNIVSNLFDSSENHGTVTFDNTTELLDFLENNSEQILNLYKNLSII